jgi:hypothetical protein
LGVEDFFFLPSCSKRRFPAGDNGTPDVPIVKVRGVPVFVEVELSFDFLDSL